MYNIPDGPEIPFTGSKTNQIYIWEIFWSNLTKSLLKETNITNFTQNNKLAFWVILF